MYNTFTDLSLQIRICRDKSLEMLSVCRSMEYSVLGHAVTQRSQSKAEEILKDILTGTGLRGNHKKRNIWKNGDRTLFHNAVLLTGLSRYNKGTDGYKLVGSYRLVESQHESSAPIGHWLRVIHELLETLRWTNPSLYHQHNAGPLQTAKCSSRRKFLGT